jgi:pyrimidine deaminase RibD-like protein
MEIPIQDKVPLDSSGESDDRKFARLAIEEARKSVPEDERVHPRVGVVIVKDGRVLATAHRGEFPQCHGEYIALEKKLGEVSLAGSTVYTTLEPCTSRNHPKVPCAVRLTERKVARVVIGMLDPDDRISGRGQRALRKAGIATELFDHDLMTEIEELNRDFIREKEANERNTNVSGDRGGNRTPVVVSRHNSTPAPISKPEPRCNIRFTGVGIGKIEQTRVLSRYAGQVIEYAAAGFENEAIEGKELRIPRVKARVIFYHPDGHIIADVSSAAWIRPNTSPPMPYMRLEANTPKHVLLFFLAGGQLTCRSVERTMIGKRSYLPYREHKLNGNIGTVEIQLLTDTEKLYSVKLGFKDEDDNMLPTYAGIVGT